MTPTRKAGRIELRTEQSSAVLDLEDGARLTSLRFDDLELLVPKDDRASLWWGSFVMAPWTGDLTHGVFDFNGRSYDVARDPGPHAAHGTVRQAAWTATGPTSARAELGPGWPFAGAVALDVALDDAQLTMRVRLEAGEDMPAAVGLHPWFARRLTPTGAPVRLTLPRGSDMLVRRADGSPTAEFMPLGPPPWNETVRLPVSSVVMAWPGDGQLWLTWNTEYATVFTADPQGVCVEPVTSPSGRMDHSLQAGQALELSMSAHWSGWPAMVDPANPYRP